MKGVIGGFRFAASTPRPGLRTGLTSPVKGVRGRGMRVPHNQWNPRIKDPSSILPLFQQARTVKIGKIGK